MLFLKEWAKPSCCAGTPAERWHCHSDCGLPYSRKWIIVNHSGDLCMDIWHCYPTQLSLVRVVWGHRPCVGLPCSSCKVSWLTALLRTSLLDSSFFTRNDVLCSFMPRCGRSVYSWDIVVSKASGRFVVSRHVLIKRGEGHGTNGSNCWGGQQADFWQERRLSDWLPHGVFLSGPVESSQWPLICFERRSTKPHRILQMLTTRSHTVGFWILYFFSWMQ